jgi:hypothetical protein
MNTMKKLALTAALLATVMSSTSAFAADTHGLVQGYGTSNPAPQPNWNANGYNHDGTASMPNDTTMATSSVTRSFFLTGSVAQDCSYYTGGSNSQTINLGAIGVRNGDAEDVGTLYNQVDTLNVDNQSNGAGCNTDNTVTVTKTNGANGLSNPTTSGFDTDNFTNHIPYSITTGIKKATAAGVQTWGQYRSFTVGTGASTGSATFGAWRSQINVHVNIPAQSLGLVAGTYSDTITVTLAAGVS